MSTPRFTDRAWRPLVALAAVLLASLAGAQHDADAHTLPVDRVVLFSTGVAYVEHVGRVDGDAAVELRVPSADMDDLLQSLVVADLGGGRVDGVRYGARDPLARILRSYAIDLSGNPTLAQILAQARGETVHVTTATEQAGTIVSVERVDVPGEASRTFLTLATPGGLTRVDLADVQALRFERETLRAQLDAALAAIVDQRDADAVPVRIAFVGEGEREVRVGYLREMPVWKTSYRLSLGDDGVADLQGWAIFDNPTSLDFDDVALTFVAGQPASFVSALYEPVYAPRPRVDVAIASGFVPPTDAGGVAAETSRMMMAAPMATMEADAFAPGVGGVEALADATGGGATFSYAVRDRVSVARYESVLVPILRAEVEAHDVSLHADAARHPLRAVRVVNDTALHLAPGPVTVFDEAGFTGTALIGDVLPGEERILAYAVDLELAVDVSGRSEPEQVVSVRFDAGLLVSEHRTRIATRYAIDVRGDAERTLVVEIPRRDGFELIAPTPAPPRTPDAWRVGVAIGDAAPTPEAAVATQVACDGAAPCAFEVVLERLDERRVAVANVPLERIEVYLRDLDLDGTTRSQLEAIATLLRDLARIDRAIADERARRTAIADDQARIRQNMAELDRDTPLYARYVDDLGAQEDELLAIAERVEALGVERASLQRDLDTLIASLGT